MKSFGWFVVGVVSGLVAGHQVAKTPAGKAIVAELTAIGREFTNGVKEGYAEGSAKPIPKAKS